MKLKTYITSTDFRHGLKHPRVLIREMCIDALLNSAVSEHLKLEGIICPSWTNQKKITEYRGIPVQNVETRDLSNLETHGHCPVIGYSKKRSSYDADNEHLSLIENMQIETPCIVIDSDILIYANHRLKSFVHKLCYSSLETHCICAFHAIYFKDCSFQEKGLEFTPGYFYNCPKIQSSRDDFFRCSTHFSRAMYKSMGKYKLIKK